jgi:hypothetical protein
VIIGGRHLEMPFATSGKPCLRDRPCLYVDVGMTRKRARRRNYESNVSVMQTQFQIHAVHLFSSPRAVIHPTLGATAVQGPRCEKLT